MSKVDVVFEAVGGATLKDRASIDLEKLPQKGECFHLNGKSRRVIMRSWEYLPNGGVILHLIVGDTWS